ncbi:carbohydrate kinase [Thermus sp.]|uniref:carbohydrate kinase family protein n=1 Tax=Thermus sp. TaxID=275 RepID=UPI00298EE2BF|nr:carbohydrate kinase [Thermus sp.]MDW8357564.1 carbohydrate kinase [Thermus sp.]
MLALAGEVLLDLLWEEATPWRFQGVLGGSVLNTATALRRLGFPVRLLSELGSDWLSRRCEAEMEARGLELRLLRHPEAMPLALVQPNPQGEAAYSFHLPFRAPYRPEPGSLRGARVFHFASLFALDPRTEGGLAALLEEAWGEGALLAFDPNLRRPPTPEERRRLWGYFHQVDLLKLSLEDARLLFPEDPVGRVRGLPPRLKVLTLGAEGAVAFFRGEAVRLPGETVAVADTVGAGDSFTAGFLALLLRRGYTGDNLDQLRPEDLEEALRGGIALGALACTVRGAGLPEAGLAAWKKAYLGD